MMIELIIFNYLKEKLPVPVLMFNKDEDFEEYVIFEKTSSSEENKVKSATFAFQSYADTLYEAAKLNEKLKEVIEDIIELDQVSKIKLNSDYNFTDVQSKKHRYQAVYDIYY